MKLSVIGAGYVGLVTAAVFSELGNEVTCVEINEARVDKLKKNIVPFFEPQLAEYIERNQSENRLSFTTSYEKAIPGSNVIFICVGTPPNSDGSADLSYLFDALEKCAKNLDTDALIVIKSTFPIGFEKEMEDIVTKSTKKRFEFAACPEFLKEGTAIEDALHPDRVVLGTTSKKAQDLLLKLHEPIPGERILTDIKSAQLIKYAANSFLATKISFANAIANICELTGANAKDVLEGIGADKRIGHSFLKSGIGYGGSCLPKDVLAFIAQARSVNYNFSLLESVDSINQSQVDLFINKILKTQKIKDKNLSGLHFAVLGLAFKPNTDDMREAPSIKIINRLKEMGAKVTAYDPEATENAKTILPDVNYSQNLVDALKGKDAMLVLTEWPEFLEMDLKNAKSLLKSPIIIDGRNIFNRKDVETLGFVYEGIGQ